MPIARPPHHRRMESDLVDFERDYFVVVRRTPQTGASVYEIHGRSKLVGARPLGAKPAGDSLLRRLLGDVGEEVKTPLARSPCTRH
jgi:hypothetical protein